ncbi:YheC/YheD family endospore coat-associated protein [Paenibacillus sp. IITD108]|uniref:YheC/YheD family endospore coat-associated protein n=1 Tax=Paenibacillus sp. IITD108 TaxID=3116649 RepID=UPI002F427DA0
MSLTTCNIRFSSQYDNVIYLSNPLLKQLELEGKRAVHIVMGNATVKAAIRKLNRSSKVIYISSGVRQALRVPKIGQISIQTVGPDEIRIGPLVGILTDTLRPGESYPFGLRASLVKQIIRVGEKRAFIFGFTPNDINWRQQTVNGFFLNPQGGWTRKVVPLPDVVYNRLPNRRAEASTSLRAFRERFVNHSIPFFNWSFLNKSDVYRLLDNDPEALVHLPESINNPTPATIKEMLEKHQFIYYKPTGGSLGIGIYRLTYQPGRGYFARFRRNNQNVLMRFKNFGSLMRMLQARHGSKLENYVVQQGIRLIEMDKCPIDFRFHMHKNGRNEWVPAGIGAKKAGRGSVTTHVKSGGSLLTPMHALHRTFGDKADEVLERAKQVSIKLSEAIERNYPHRLGELGLDIGIDNTGEIWMFEANAKPGRSIFKHPALKAEGRDSLSYIFDHCLYLSRFNGGSS